MRISFSQQCISKPITLAKNNTHCILCMTVFVCVDGISFNRDDSLNDKLHGTFTGPQWSKPILPACSANCSLVLKWITLSDPVSHSLIEQNKAPCLIAMRVLTSLWSCQLLFQDWLNVISVMHSRNLSTSKAWWYLLTAFVFPCCLRLKYFRGSL